MEFNATFLISAINFIVFVVIMNFIFYKPIEDIVKKRDNFIDENYAEAKKNNSIAKKLAGEHDEKIADANFRGKSLMEEKFKEAKKQKTSMVKNAQKQATDDIIKNHNELDKAFEKTGEDLKYEVENLAKEVSLKLFGDKINLGGQ